MTPVEGVDVTGNKDTVLEGSAARRGACPVDDMWMTPVEGEDDTGSIDASLKRSAAQRGTGPADDKVKTSVKAGGRDWVAMAPMEVLLVVKLTAPVAWVTDGTGGMEAAASSC